MRGSGTIFGADQSGSQDIGLDLQANMLSKALDAIRNKNKTNNTTNVVI